MRDAFIILFLGQENSSGSILAESLIKHIAPERFAAYSAGILPSGKIDPLVQRILKENFDIDPSMARSKSWDEFKFIHFDFIITLSAEVREACPAWPGQPIIAHWDFPGSEAFRGTEESAYWETLETAREIQRCIERFSTLPLHTMERADTIAAVQEIGLLHESHAS